MFEFMTNTVIMTQFLFIVALDLILALKGICWIFRKMKKR